MLRTDLNLTGVFY